MEEKQKVPHDKVEGADFEMNKMKLKSMHPLHQDSSKIVSFA